MPTTNSHELPSPSFLVKTIAMFLFCVAFILFSGTVFDAMGVAFGIEQVVMTTIAGMIGSFRLFSSQ